MKRPAIFFDRDNTLIANDGYLGDASKVLLIDDAADAVARARSLGFATVVISNQSGVARGMFGEDDVMAVNRRMDELLLEANGSAVIDRHEFCPFHPDATVELYKQDSDRRKPSPGMIHAAAEKLALDLSRSWVIGDAPRDIEAGNAAGCRTVLVKNVELAKSPAAETSNAVEPDYTVSSLKEAMDFIALHLNGQADAIKLPTNGRVQQTNKPDRLEQAVDQILTELRRRNEHHEYNDFSITKLLAGITQVLSLAMLLMSYLKFSEKGNEANFYPFIYFAIYLQTLTIALLIMGRQK